MEVLPVDPVAPARPQMNLLIESRRALVSAEAGAECPAARLRSLGVEPD